MPLFTWWGRLPRSPRFHLAVMLELIAGWIATEVGRQPWIVNPVMRTSNAVTASGGLEVGFAVLVAVYAGSRPRSPGCCTGSPRGRRAELRRQEVAH